MPSDDTPPRRQQGARSGAEMTVTLWYGDSGLPMKTLTLDVRH